MKLLLSFLTRRPRLFSPPSGRLLLLLPMMGWAMTPLLSQTTWTGSAGTDWNNAANWSAGVPEATDDVIILDAASDPILGTAGAVAQSIIISQRRRADHHGGRYAGDRGGGDASHV